MKRLILVALILSGCAEEKCVRTEEIVTVGSCTFGGHYGPECVAKTETGRKVSSRQPWMVGDLVCVEKQ